MKLEFRYIRSLLFLIPAVLALTTDIALEGLSIAFAVTSLSGAFASMVYVFIHFDEKINVKIIMEGLSDAFFGIVLVTYPLPSGQFFLVIFSAWLFVMGLFMLSGGFSMKGNESFFWFYLLVGISYIAMGFVVMNYNPSMLEMIPYVLGIILLTYSVINVYLLAKRKVDIYALGNL